MIVSLLLHPVHVTITGIDYDEKMNLFSLYVKVYSDDMEQDMIIGDSQKGDSYSMDKDGFQGWLSNRLIIKENGKPLKLELMRIETDADEHKFFLQAKGSRHSHSVTISNTINVRLYEDQSNMIMFKYREIEEGFKLSPSDTLKVFNVN